MNKLKLKLLVFGMFLVIFFGEGVLAQPSITSAPSSVSDGENVVVLGLGFGINSLDIEWLGQHIEDGTEGGSFSKTDWGTAGDTTYTMEDKHSGEKSVLLNMGPATGIATIIHNIGAHITDEVYITWWIKWSRLEAGEGQFKWFRLRKDGSVNDVVPEIYFSYWSNSVNRAFLRPGGFCEVIQDSMWYSTDQGDRCGTKNYADSEAPQENEWCRVEIFATASTEGSKDGSFYYRLHKSESVIPIIETPINYDGTLMTFNAGMSDRWQYVVFGHWRGNGMGHTKEWVDDIYIQVGTQARLEIGNTPTWSTNTHREIQRPTAWSDGSINFKVNQGSFPNGDAYLFVVDENEVVSGGYPITFGGVSDCGNSVCDTGECDTCPQDCNFNDCCPDGTCNNGENCGTCLNDCPIDVGQVCCSGAIYTGNCCDNTDCTSPETCNNHVCSEISGVCEGLNLLMHFDNDLIDYSGNGNDGSFFGNANYDSDGKFGSSVYYDGNGDAVIIPDSASLSPTNQALTIAAWIKMDGSQAIGDRLVHKNGAWHLTMRGSSSVGMGMYQGGWSAVNSISICSDGEWCYVVGTYDGTDMSIYVDGVFDNSVAKTGSMVDSSDNLYIGLDEDGSSYAFRGNIDEVAIWNRVLTGNEIAELYSGGAISCETQSQCCLADNNPEDGVVDIAELMNYIGDWKLGSVTIESLMTGIGEWKNGC